MATTRRAFFTSLLMMLAAPITGHTQQAGKPVRIGDLSGGTAAVNAGLRKAFIDGLRDHGWIEDRNIAIEYRWQGAGELTFDALAAELVRLPLDLIVAVNTPAALATKRTGTPLPVVFAQVSEPVATGLVDTLARPGRNVTGLTTINRELMAERLALLKETIPALTRVGYLANPGYAVHAVQLAEMGSVANSLGLTLHLAEVRAASEIDSAFARVASAQVGALIVQQDDLLTANRAVIVDRAAKRRLPAMYVFSLYPESGGLMSYGAQAEDLYRRAAHYVDRILKGAKPSELPVERPNKFELVINLRTAKAVGITIPPSLLLRADHVID